MDRFKEYLKFIKKYKKTDKPISTIGKIIHTLKKLKKIKSQSGGSARNRLIDSVDRKYELPLKTIYSESDALLLGIKKIVKENEEYKLIIKKLIIILQISIPKINSIYELLPDDFKLNKK